MSSTASFESLQLSPPTLKALGRAGYQRPTPIQAGAVPPALAGQDVIGCAATGTGKTAAFVLPMVERLAGKDGTRGLVLAPTRELALQIAEHLTTFGGPHRVFGAVVIGGESARLQEQALRRRPHVVVATPGRLVDHLAQRTVSLAQVEVLVLDEADRMLDMGFKPQLQQILRHLPKKRQTLLFSATMAGEVADFAKSHLHAPVKVEVARSGTTAARAEQAVYTPTALEKMPLLLTLLAAGDESTLVFTRTKRRADKVARVLQRFGQRVARIHADRTQAQRRQALDGFKAGKVRVLVATDIAARGIDVEEIGHVINFDLPLVPEDYVHRIGRTARASASGLATSFVSPEELPLLKGIERLVRTPLPRKPLPHDSPVFQDAVEKAKAAAKDPGPPQRPGRPPPRKTEASRRGPPRGRRGPPRGR